MSESDLAELRAWAVAHATAGSARAAQVLRLLEHCSELKQRNLSLAERVAAQSELLTRRAEDK